MAHGTGSTESSTLKDLHWTSIFTKQDASYELTQPVSLLDNWLPARSTNGSSLALRSDVLLPAFENAVGRLNNSRSRESKQDQHVCILTVLLTGYVILKPYLTAGRMGSEQRMPSDPPFYSDISTQLQRLADAESQWHHIKNLSSVHDLIFDQSNHLNENDLTALTHQSPLQILGVDPALRLADLANYRAHQPSATELLVEATQRTLSLSEIGILLEQSLSASDVQAHEMVLLAEKNPKVAVELIRRSGDASMKQASADNDHIRNIFIGLGSQLPPNNFRSRDLFYLLSQKRTFRTHLVQLSLPVWLSRCFDHIRSSHRRVLQMQDGPFNDNDSFDESLIHRDEIPRAIQMLVGFMEQTGLLQDVQAEQNNRHDADDDGLAEVHQNLAIEIKAFAVDMVKYQPARDLYKRLI